LGSGAFKPCTILLQALLIPACVTTSFVFQRGTTAMESNQSR
jgi:hypothetical protein